MTYLYQPAVRKSTVIAVAELLYGGMGSFIWGVGLLLPFAGKIEFSEIPLVLLMLIPHLLIFFAGMRRAGRNMLARRIDSTLSGDMDGAKRVKDLANNLGMSEAKLAAGLDWLMQRHFFDHCILERDGVPTLYFHVGEDARALDPQKRITVVRCPHCGASNTLTAGKKGKCEYCDGPISSRL